MYATARSPCNCCKANTADIPWTDVQAEALWRATVWNRTTWEAAFPDRSVIFTGVPGFSVLNYFPDVMHVCHLGTCQYFLGSVLEYLVTHVLDGSAEKCVERIWEVIQQSYQDQPYHS